MNTESSCSAPPNKLPKLSILDDQAECPRSNVEYSYFFIYLNGELILLTQSTSIRKE